MMMDGSESSLEWPRVSGDGAFIVRNVLPCPTPRSIQNPALDFTLGGCWLPVSGCQSPVYIQYGWLVFWVVSPSRDTVRFLISLQNSLLHELSSQLKFPTLGESHWRSCWSQFEQLSHVYSTEKSKAFGAWPALSMHPLGPMGTWTAEGLLDCSLLLIINYWNPPKNFNWNSETRVIMKSEFLCFSVREARQGC